MAGHARYTAILDACVLVSNVTADTLMTLATARFFAAKWTVRIEEEWISALDEMYPDNAGKFVNRRDAMRDAVLDWEVDATACEKLIPCLELPDPGDKHVLAAAIAGHSDCIVTANLKHFPSSCVSPYGIEVVHPDDFIIQQWDLEPLLAIAAMKRMRIRRKNPAYSVEQLAAALKRSGLFKASERLLAVHDLA